MACCGAREKCPCHFVTRCLRFFKEAALTLTSANLFMRRNNPPINVHALAFPNHRYCLSFLQYIQRLRDAYLRIPRPHRRRGDTRSADCAKVFQLVTATGNLFRNTKLF